MKFTVISDTHNLHSRLKFSEITDCIIHCGDATNKGGITEFRHFCKWFGSLPFKHKIFVAGNHDKGLCSENRQILLEFLKEEGIIYLENESYFLNGIHIYGSPITPKFGNWGFGRQRGEEIAKTWALIPPNVDILITHGPPYGILDQNYSGWHCGCEELAKIIPTINPKFHFFGHIHEFGGQSKKMGPTTFVNVSFLDEYYSPKNSPFIFEI